MIVLHGPAGSPTGLGHALSYLTRSLREDHAIAAVCGPNPELWNVPGYHLVIDQPMSMNPSWPWHGFMPFFELPLRADEIAKLFLKGPKSTLYAANPWIYQQLHRLYPETPDPVSMMPLGAESGRVSMLPRRPGTILTVGKAEPRKGTNILFEALKIGGWIAYLAILSPLHSQQEREYIQKMSDENNWQLLPFSQSHEQVRALFDVCHVAVFPSCAEGWNLGLTEALAQGCVVVASDIPAHRYQWEIMAKVLGEVEVAKRFLLVQTHPTPIRGHSRWYPEHLYQGHTWLECTPQDLAAAIQVALRLPFPEAWGDGQFPLSWKRSAQQLLQRVREVYQPKTLERP